MVNFIEGQWVWMPHPRESWLPVQLISQSSSNITCRSAEDEHFTIPQSLLFNLQLVHPSSLQLNSGDSSNSSGTIENLTELEELSEGAILHNLRARYKTDLIYTNISSILLSINPYKLLPYYGPSTIQHYHHSLTNHQTVSPHIYSLAHSAYSQLCSTNKPQSVVIAGESGAGKTESTKLVLQYLADVSGAGDDVEQQILEANPIIEAFGNAKTLKNNNSSRFGKWIEITFNDKNKITGSQIYQYLLEKSRVVQQSDGEANFHIFYALCQGASEQEKQRYHLLPSTAFKILGGAEMMKQEEIPLKDVKYAMKVLHFTENQQDCIFRVLAAILHLGNLIFVESGNGRKGVTIQNEKVITIIAELLSLDGNLLKKSLVTRRLLVGGEVITQLHSVDQCIEMQQSLCKAFYDSLFHFLIDHINQTLQPSATSKSSTSSPHSADRWIGVLDIFGFENFPINYWEQLCINYANEKLQQHFISVCLSLDQAEYKREEISIQNVEFQDNSGCLELIEQKRIGIFDMISEEIKLPKGNDQNLLNRMHTAYDTSNNSTNQKKVNAAASTFYQKPKTNTPQFTIKHYAGDVQYQINGFLEKNKGDLLSEDVYEAMDSSTEDFIKDLLYWAKKEMATPTTQTTQTSTPATHSSLLPEPRSHSKSISGLDNSPGCPTRKLSGNSQMNTNTVRGTSRNQAPTMGSQFRLQLSDLMSTLNQTQPHFLKCLKPNADKVADYFDGVFISRQLAYLGIKEVIEVRKSGFPVRLKRDEFLRRYRLLVENSAVPNSMVEDVKVSSEEEKKQRVKEMMLTLKVATESWINGKTKVLMKANVQSLLEDRREKKMSQLIVRIQARWKGKLLTRRFKLLKACYRDLTKFLSTSSTTSLLNTSIASIDTLISRASDFDLPAAILQSARQYRLRVYNAQSCQRSLAASVQNKDRQVIEAAVSYAKEIGLDSCPELLTAQQWLAANDSYLRDVNAAMKNRDLELLNKCVAYAHSMTLDTPLEQAASKLQKQLQAEASVVKRLSALLAATDPSLSLLNSILSEASQLQMSHSMISEGQKCKERLESLAAERERQIAEKLSAQGKKVEEWRSKLKMAIDTRSTSVLSVLIGMLEEDEYTEMKGDMENDPLYQQSVSLREQLITLATDSEAAILSRDPAMIKKLIDANITLGVDKTDQVNRMRAVLEDIERAKELKQLLKTAIESRQRNILTNITERVEKRRQQQQNQHIDDEEQQLMNKAKLLLKEIQKEEQLHEQDVAAIHTVASTETKQQQQQQREKDIAENRQATNSISCSTNNVLRRAAQFYSAPFLTPSLSLHLCPLLRSPDDFVKGKWMGKDKLKKGMLIHSKEALPRSLTQLDGMDASSSNTATTTDSSSSAPCSLNDLALNIFKNIQGWMGDRMYSFPDSLAYDILSIGLNEVNLRDEIYLQVIKQIRENQKLDSIVRGWQLVGLLSECFLPSSVCLPYLYHFLLTNSCRQDALLLGYINYTIHTLHHSHPSLAAPSLTHITSFRDRLMHTLILPLSFPDGSQIDIEVSPELNCNHIIQQVKKWLGIINQNSGDDDTSEDENADGLAIYMCGPGTAELCLSGEECLLDFPASQCQDGSMYFLLKKRMFTAMTTDLNHLHPILLSMLYHQCVLDSCHGVYDLHRSELIEILAIHRQLITREYFAVIGKETDTMITIQHLKPLVFQYWDPSAITKFEQEIEATIKHQQSSMDAGSIHPSLVYEILKKKKEFAAQLFLVSQDERTELPHSLLLAVNTYGICLINETTKKLISAFKYQHITGWASNSVRFCLRVLVSKGKTVQLNFKTAQGKRMVRCVQEYVEFLMKEQQRKARLSVGGKEPAIVNSNSKKNEKEEEKENDNEVASAIQTETVITVL